MSEEGSEQRLGIYRNRCPVCNLPEHVLVQVDTMLATPKEELLSELFDGVPEEDIPANAYRWTSLTHALQWLDERGFVVKGRGKKGISKGALQLHFDKHLPLVPMNRQEIARTGYLSTGQPAPESPEPYMAAIQFHAYYKLGMDIGFKALRKLEERLDDLTPTQQLAVAKIGQQLAQSQASIFARGQRFDVEDDDAMSGFLDDEDISPRFGSIRVREVDGEMRPVRDEGPADRERFNRRARQEGGTELPST